MARRGVGGRTGSAASVVTAGTAQALPNLPGSWHGHVYNFQSPRCLDASTPNVKLRNCNSTSYQSWIMGIRSPPAHITTDGRCLDEGAGTNGYPAKVATCDSSNPHQKWYYLDNATIVSAASGRCLDADTGTINQDGTKVTVGTAGARRTSSGTSSSSRTDGRPSAYRNPDRSLTSLMQIPPVP